MALEVQLTVGGHQADAAYQSTARVPAGIIRFAGVGPDGDDILLTKFQLVGHVNRETHVAVVGAADALTV